MLFVTVAIVVGVLGVLSLLLFMIVFILQNRAFKKEMREAEKEREFNRKNFDQRVKDMDFAFEERKRQRREEESRFEQNVEWRWTVVKPSFTTRSPSKESESPKRKRPDRPLDIVVVDGKIVSGLTEKEEGGDV